MTARKCCVFCGGELNELQRAVLETSQVLKRTSSLTSATLELLRFAPQGLTASEIAQLVRASESAVSARLNELERREKVKRDGRRVSNAIRAHGQVRPAPAAVWFVTTAGTAPAGA